MKPLIISLLYIITCLIQINSLVAENSASLSAVEELCDKNPLIECPVSIWLQPTESTDPMTTGIATVQPGSPDCRQPIIEYADEIISNGICDKTTIRSWVAYDRENISLRSSCVQNIVQQDAEPPAIVRQTEDLLIYTSSEESASNDCAPRVTWMSPKISDNHILVSITTTILHNGEVSDLKSGSDFPTGITTVEYIAEDYCGNISSLILTIEIICSDCHLICPDSFSADFGSDIAPSIAGQPYAYNDNCGQLLSATSVDRILEGSECQMEQITERVWSGVFSSRPDTIFSCVQQIGIPSLAIFNCPENVIVEDNYVAVHWNAPVVLTSNNAMPLTTYSDHQPGSHFPLGSSVVTYTGVDTCMNEVSCSFEVLVLSDASSDDCPSDITIKADSDGVGVVDYVPPAYNGTCTSCQYGGYKPGFKYMGSYSGSNYYISKEEAKFNTALSMVDKHGGQLASINSEEENDFITSNLNRRSALIGLTDRSKEGKFEWLDGASVNYTNWYYQQPSNQSDQDLVEILNPSGRWNDVSIESELHFIMELPCQNVELINGPRPGEELEIGNYEVEYQISDGCNFKQFCSFTITVSED